MSDPCDSAPARLGPGVRASLHLEVRLPDGTVALNTFDEPPLDLTFGDGTLAPALEAALAGLEPGGATQILGDGSLLFAPYDPANRHWLEADQFPDELRPDVGTVIGFTTPGGHETAGIVLQERDGRIEVDFNHPLSGKSLLIRVLVLAVDGQSTPPL